MTDLTDEDEIQPWERQPGETEVMYAHFRAYLDQIPPRSFRRLEDETGVGYRALLNYSYKGGWAERCEAWDREVTRREIDVTLEEVGRRRRRRLRELDTQIDRAVRRIRTLRDDEISAQAARSMLIESIKLEQLLIGEATERVDQGERLDLGQLSDDELLEYRRMIRKMESSGGGGGGA